MPSGSSAHAPNYKPAVVVGGNCENGEDSGGNCCPDGTEGNGISCEPIGGTNPYGGSGPGSGGGSGGSANNTGAALRAKIAANASSYHGSHSCPSNLGGNGCMWAVQQVAGESGGDQIGNGVLPDYIPSATGTALKSGQLTQEATYPGGTISGATGDLVVWWGGDGQTTFAGCQADVNCDEHIGICLNSTCTGDQGAIANSTSNSSNGVCSFTDYGSATSPQGQSSGFTNSTILQVNY